MAGSRPGGAAGQWGRTGGKHRKGGPQSVFGRLIAGTLVFFATLALVAAALRVLSPATTSLTPIRVSHTQSTVSPPPNLLVGDQADFAHSAGGWTADQGTATWNPSAGKDDSGCLQVEADGSNGVSAWSGIEGAGATTADSSSVYRGSAQVVAVGTTARVTAAITFYDADGDVLNAAFGQAVTATPQSWQAPPQVVGLAPAGTASMALGIVLWNTTPGQQVDVGDAWLQTTPDQAPALAGPLSVSGNHILDTDGQPVTLRGINYPDLATSAQPADLSKQTFAEMKAWGANTVRIALGEQFWLTSSCAFDPNYVSTVDSAVNWVTSLGMVAVLDLHLSNPGDLDAPSGSCPPAGQQEMADDPGSLEFWNQVASRYAGNPLVAFDLFNEPYSISTNTWLDGGPVSPGPGEPSFDAAGMQQLYNAVRATGARNLVFVSGNNWATDVPATLVSGTNIVYSAHYYTCPINPPPNCTTGDPDTPAPVLDKWDVFSQDEPVVLPEFGWPSAWDGAYNTNAIGFAVSHGWGWIAFGWESGIFDLRATDDPTGTVEPSPAGMPVLNSLAIAATRQVSPPSRAPTITATTAPRGVPRSRRSAP